MKKYTVIKKLQSSSYSIVYLITQSREERILKITTALEVEIHRKLANHETDERCLNIIGIISSTKNKLVLEKADTDLMDLLNKKTSSKTEIIEMYLTILKTVEYIHSQGIVHADIKPENIFILQDSIKLGDFGLSFYNETTGVRGTLEYIAPETVLGCVLDYRIDIWALGILIHEIWSFHIPYVYSDETSEEIYTKIVNYDLVYQPVPFRDLLYGIFVHREKRISLTEIIKYWENFQILNL